MKRPLQTCASNYICNRCGHEVQDELNIEASIHHSNSIVCFDNKACKRRAKKKK